MPAGDDLRVLAVLAEQRDRVVDRLGPRILERRRDHCPPPPLAAWIARHTFCGDTGRWMSVTPRCDSASITAFTTAGGDAIVPVSPTPFTPSSFDVDGVTVRSIVMLGTSEAAGIS